MSSFNEESGRYKVLAPTFYAPGVDRPLVQVGKPGAYTFTRGSRVQQFLTVNAIRHQSESAYATYQGMLSAGIAREVARLVLPVNVFTSFYWTVNARSLMNFLSLRSTFTEPTVPTFPMHEIDRAAQRVERLFAALMPITYRTFVANGRVAP